MQNQSNGTHKNPDDLLKPLVEWIMSDTEATTKIADRLKQQLARRIIWSPESQQQAILAARFMMLASMLEDALVIASTGHKLAMQGLDIYCSTTRGLPPIEIKVKDLRPAQEMAIKALTALGLPETCIVRKDGGDDGNQTSPIILAKG